MAPAHGPTTVSPAPLLLRLAHINHSSPEIRMFTVRRTVNRTASVVARAATPVMGTRATPQTLARNPAVRRSYVYVTEANGHTQIGRETLTPAELYHSPSKPPLPLGRLAPRPTGSAVNKTMQPKEFDAAGGPQVTPKPQAALLFTGSFQPGQKQKLYQLYLNPYASEQVQRAIDSGQSNEYVRVAPAGMNFSSQNATALGGGDKTALQLTSKALTSEAFIGALEEVPAEEVQDCQARMYQHARKLPPADEKLREYDTKTGEPSLNHTLNEIIEGKQ
jgi:hypothetical protein